MLCRHLLWLSVVWVLAEERNTFTRGNCKGKVNTEAKSWKFHTWICRNLASRLAGMYCIWFLHVGCWMTNINLTIDHFKTSTTFSSCMYYSFVLWGGVAVVSRARSTRLTFVERTYKVSGDAVSGLLVWEFSSSGDDFIPLQDKMSFRDETRWKISCVNGLPRMKVPCVNSVRDEFNSGGTTFVPGSQDGLTTHVKRKFYHPGTKLIPALV